MADPNALAAAARQVAEFAAAAAVAAPGDDPAATAARAALARDWPAVRLLLGGLDPADADLAADLTAAADRTRAGRSAGWMTRARKYFGGHDPAEPVPPDLLDRAAARLKAGGLGAELARLIGEWQADDAVAWLTDLQDRLAAGPAGDVLDRLAARGAAAPADGAFASFGAPARMAARAARLVAADLASRTADAQVWRQVREWVAEWFRAAGVDGELVITAKSGVVDSAVEAVFDLTSTPGKRVVLRVRPEPPRPRSAVATWADLPAPPGWVDALAPDWLVTFHADARRADADPALAPPTPDGVKPKFARWIEYDDDGRRWFHKFLTAAARNPAGAAAGWWRQLRGSYWCRAYPDLDPDAEVPTPEWPADGLPTWPAAESVASDRPPGAVVSVERYAATPELARVVLSDGPSEPDSQADRFHRLYQAIGPSHEWWGGRRWEAAREVSLARPATGDRRPAELALKWLDLLSDDDQRLTALGRWAEGFGLTIVRPADAATGPRPGLTVRAVFADDAPGKFVRGHGYGLVAGTEVLRAAVAEVSLGRAPAGFEAVEAAASALPIGHPLRDRAMALREAVRGDYLMEAALRLYVDCWVELAPPASPAAAFADALTRFLTATYGLTPFSPASLHDCPDGWVVAATGSRAVSGGVQKVRRPGLKDEHGNLRIPALVEVE